MNLTIGDASQIIGKSISTKAYFDRQEELIRKHVSSNNILFWVRSSLFNHFSFYIMKDSPEGQKLASMLEDTGITDVEIIIYIDTLAVKHLPIEELMAKIEEMRQDAFNEGKNHIRKEFRKLMSIQ